MKTPVVIKVSGLDESIESWKKIADKIRQAADLCQEYEYKGTEAYLRRLVCDLETPPDKKYWEFKEIQRIKK